MINKVQLKAREGTHEHAERSAMLRWCLGRLGNDTTRGRLFFRESRLVGSSRKNPYLDSFSRDLNGKVEEVMEEVSSRELRLISERSSSLRVAFNPNHRI